MIQSVEIAGIELICTKNYMKDRVECKSHSPPLFLYLDKTDGVIFWYSPTRDSESLLEIHNPVLDYTFLGKLSKAVEVYFTKLNDLPYYEIMIDDKMVSIKYCDVHLELRDELLIIGNEEKEWVFKVSLKVRPLEAIDKTMEIITELLNSGAMKLIKTLIDRSKKAGNFKDV